VDLPGLATGGRYAGNQRRVEHRDEVEGALAPAIARLSTAELLRRLEAARIAYASVRGVGQVVAHPQLAGLWTAISAGDREVEVLPPPVTHSGSGPALGPVPRLGQHTEAVLAEFAEDGPVPGPDPRPAPDDDGDDPPASATDSEAAGPG